MSGSSPAVLRPVHLDPRPLVELVSEFHLRSDDELAGLAASGIAVAAAHVHDGDLFIGLQGAHSHGASFAAQARERGAVALLTDEAGAEIARGVLPVIIDSAPRERLGAVSAWMYRTVDAALTVFGVTGTNGKTSTAYLLDAVLRQLGDRTALSTTAERVVDGERHASRLTTPESPELHAMLALIRERGLDAATLEVSAQALQRHRVDGLVFDVVGFTNLSHDHLDDFGTMERYLETKAELFSVERARRGVVCLDSPWGARMAELATVPLTTVSTRADAKATWTVDVLDEHPDRTRFSVSGPEGRLELEAPVIGVHMASNAALAIVMVLESGRSFDEVAAALGERCLDVYLPGRAERVSGDSGPSVFVDFGHSADAFATTLTAVRRFTTGKLIMVCGASGDRDPSKRGEMGRVASELSDVLVITDHHSRSEEPQGIREALMEGARAAEHAAELHEVVPPELAIRHAIALAHEGDSIVWAGPGHLDYRDVGGVKLPFSARDIARTALVEAGWSS